MDDDVKNGFIKQVIMPDERRNSIQIPKEWFGKRVEVILYTTIAGVEKPPSNATPFMIKHPRIKSKRAAGSPELLSENLVRADRDGRESSNAGDNSDILLPAQKRRAVLESFYDD